MLNKIRGVIQAVKYLFDSKMSYEYDARIKAWEWCYKNEKN